MKIAIDRDVLRRFLLADGSDPEDDAIHRLLTPASLVCILPILAEEIDRDGQAVERQWRAAGFEEVTADEFFTGCARGMAERYLDYYPDPRGCRLVAEAECAKAEALVTLDEELIRGLRGRAENIRISTPAEALNEK